MQYSDRAICEAVVPAALAQSPNPLVAWGKNNEGQCNIPKALGRVGTMAAGDTWPVAFAGGRFATWRAPRSASE